MVFSFARLAWSVVRLDYRASAATVSLGRMSRIECIPGELLFPGMVNEFVEWLKGLGIPWMDKKELLCDWCVYTNYPLTKELVDLIRSE